MPFEKIIVKENGRERPIVFGLGGDKGQDAEVVAKYTEKTREELKKLPPIEPPKKGSRENLVQQIRELQDFKRRKADSPNKKYY